MGPTNPAEAYAQAQALDASQKSAAARGGLLSTNEQMELEKNAGNIGASFENQAFNQWLQSRQQRMGGMESVAQLGQSSATNVADLGVGLTVGAGNALAAGQVGSSNIYGKGLGSLGSQFATLSQLFGTTPSSTIDPGGGGINTNSYTIDAGGVPGGVPINQANDYGMSDERLKTDIKRVGYTDDGLPVFTYRMKSGGPTMMGVMAQDVEKSNPRAVTKDPAGLRMVDYRRVH
jgi:hypothetical protein